jgi:hypothetical protein
LPRKTKFLKELKAWSRHVQLYRSVFLYSLEQLKSISKKENEISAELFVILKKVCKRWALERSMEIPAPLAQLPQQDADKAVKKGLDALPKPDFSCPKFDPDKGENLFFDVECKLLGSPTSKSWILNRNYVRDGISRFNNDHEYGKEVSDGIMIGYIISMKPTEILDEVNGYLNSICDELYFEFKGEVSATSSKLKRTTVKPENFTLIHLWVDMRNL